MNSAVKCSPSGEEQGVVGGASHLSLQDSLAPVAGGKKAKARRCGGLAIAAPLLREYRLPVRLLPSELAVLDQRRGRMSRAVYVRQAALGRELPQPVPEVNREAILELHRVGVNLNQIAMRLNAGEDARNFIDNIRDQVLKLKVKIQNLGESVSVSL